MHKRTLAALLALIALIALVSCDNVYYSGVAGTVRDADNRNLGIPDMNVYAYTSEKERDKVFASASSASSLDGFDFKSLFRTVTDTSGSWSIPKVIWTSANGDWGKDYDATSVYLIYFSRDYGLHKSGPVQVVSSTSNYYSVVEYFARETKNATLTLNFQEEGTGSSVTDTITFTYSYNDGYTERTLNGATGTGYAVIDLNYRGDSVDVSLSDVDTPNGSWAIGSYPTTITVDASEKRVDIPAFTRTSYNLGTGLSGIVSFPHGTAINYEGVEVTVEIDGTTYSVLTGAADYSNDAALRYTVPFRGLAENVNVDLSDPILHIHVGSTVYDFDLSRHFSQKNNLVVRVN